MRKRLLQKWKEIQSIRSKDDILNQAKQFESDSRHFFSLLKIESWRINLFMALPRVIFAVFLFHEVWRIKIGMPVGELQSLVSETPFITDNFEWVNGELLQWLTQLEYGFQGALMMLGLTTRLITFSFLWTISAQLMNTGYLGLWSPVLTTLFIITCLYSVVLGSGKAGVDYYISKWFSNKRKA